jgi:urease accessory protein UreE
MSTVYNPESETIAQIEKLELEAREIRRRIERSHTDEDRRVLDRQLTDVQQQIDVLRARLP